MGTSGKWPKLLKPQQKKAPTFQVICLGMERSWTVPWLCRWLMELLAMELGRHHLDGYS